MHIAFAGNPNSGKTTMFNALTGANEKVGNWVGVTVDKKEKSIKQKYTQGKEIIATDLPGTYSISPFTSEEGVTSEYVKNENADVIINVVDADNLSRSLFLTTQLLELDIPLIVALNKSDVSEKKGTTIDTAALSAQLGCPVVKTVSTSRRGLSELINTAVKLAESKENRAAASIGLNCATEEEENRKRFEFVNNILQKAEKKSENVDTLGNKIDAILTNKWLGIPIFALVMFFVFYISQSTLGTWIADGFELGDFTVPGLVTLLESFQVFIDGYFTEAHPLLRSVLIDGVIGGVIAVVGFLPLVMVMYFLIALLEDCGYMSRAAVVLDPIFKRVGLSGKSVIPFVITVGCAVPGIMASRTIPSSAADAP